MQQFFGRNRGRASGAIQNGANIAENRFIMVLAPRQ
jgi:hypothetical protein